MSLREIAGRLRGARGLSVAATFLLMIAVFYLIPTSEGKEVNTQSLYSVLQTYAAYGLLVLALGIGMIASQFDLSTLGMFALGGLLAVETGGDAPALGIAVAVAVGALAGVIQGGIVTKFKLNSMSVTLGGMLVMIGLARALSSDESVAYANVQLGIELAEPILEVLSWHSIIVTAGFVAVALAMAYTRLGRDIRAIGGDERASRVAGVRVDPILIGIFVASGMLAAAAGALNSYSLGAASPNPGFSPLIFAATAALLGGVGIAGGRGTAVGIAVGTLTLSLLQAMFGILASPEWVSQLVTGALLCVAAATAAPGLGGYLTLLRSRWRRSIEAQ